jgi:hypothetical protein
MFSKEDRVVRDGGRVGGGEVRFEGDHAELEKCYVGAWEEEKNEGDQRQELGGERHVGVELVREEEDGRGYLDASEVDEKPRDLKEKREGSKDTN